jgi:hypothetical protein
MRRLRLAYARTELPLLATLLCRHPHVNARTRHTPTPRGRSRARALAPAGAPAQPPRCAARGRVPASPGTEARDGPGSGRARTSHHCGTPVKPPYTGRQGLSRGSANGGSSGTWVRGMDRARRRARRANAARSRGGSLDLLDVNSAITADGSTQRGHRASITGSAADSVRCGPPDLLRGQATLPE